MISAALLRQTEEALRRMLEADAPADGVLRAYFRAHRALGRRDRGLIADLSFDVLRNRRLYAHWASAGRGSLEHRLVLIALAVSRDRRFELQRLPVDDTSRRWLAGFDFDARDGLAPQVRYSLPDWLYQSLVEQYGPQETEALAAALLTPAPLDLRVNTLKSTLPAAREALAAEGIDAVPVLAVPGALRVQGKPALERSRAFEQGWVEVQDAGSQWLVQLVSASRGAVVVDFCAGAGGKSLALAAAMRSSGQIYALDVSARRLQRMRARLARSGASNVQPMVIADENDPKLERLRARAERVLVDAPCSGTGTLRRNPDLKWRQQPGDVAELADKQRRILTAAARLVRPGGRLVYATCSLLRAENEAVVEAFAQLHPRFEPLASGDENDASDATPWARRLPHRHDTDAFFAAVFVRAID